MQDWNDVLWIGRRGSADCPEEKTVAALQEQGIPIALQERGRRVNQRAASPGQIEETEASVVVGVVATGVGEEAGQGLGRFLAEVGVGAEGEPGSGDALEAAQRAVGHPREDVDDEVSGEAGHAPLLPRPPRHGPICKWKIEGVASFLGLD